MPRIAAERVYPIRRAVHFISEKIRNHRVTSHLLVPLAGGGVAATIEGMAVKQAMLAHDLFPAITWFGMPPSLQYAIIYASAVGAAVLTVLETAALVLGSRRLSEINIPPRTAPDPMSRVAELRLILGREAAFLGLSLDQRIAEAQGVRDQINKFFPVLPPEEQKLAVEFIQRINDSIEREQAQPAAPPNGSPYGRRDRSSIPPPPPGFVLDDSPALGTDETIASIVPPPPAPAPVPAPAPAPAVPQVLVVPPPPARPADEPSVFRRGVRRIARAFGGGRKGLPPPPPPRRIPVSDPEFARVVAAIKQVQRTGDNKAEAVAYLERLKMTKKLDPAQVLLVDQYLSNIRSCIQAEQEMPHASDPQAKQKLEQLLQEGKARADKLGDELSVAIVAADRKVTNDEATVVIRGVDRQIQERWQEIQILLAGEAQDSVNQTKAIMQGQLWESAPTVSTGDKLAQIFQTFIKKAKHADPFTLEIINRYFSNAYWAVLLHILEKKSVLAKLGVAEDKHYTELCDLLEIQIAGSGGN